MKMDLHKDNGVKVSVQWETSSGTRDGLKSRHEPVDFSFELWFSRSRRVKHVSVQTSKGSEAGLNRDTDASVFQQIDTDDGQHFLIAALQH